MHEKPLCDREVKSCSYWQNVVELIQTLLSGIPEHEFEHHHFLIYLKLKKNNRILEVAFIGSIKPLHLLLASKSDKIYSEQIISLLKGIT